MSSELLQLGEVIQASIQACAEHSQEADSDERDLPSRALFDARRTLVAAAGKLIELVSDPSVRIQEMCLQYFESRVLHIVADRRVPDILAAAEDPETGVGIEELAEETKIEARKLSRLMRNLCSNGIFREVSPDHFANNRISAALVNNEGLRAYVALFGTMTYTCSDYLARNLNDPVKGPSYDVADTAFHDAVNTPKHVWEWIEEKVTVKDLVAGNCGYDGGPCPYPGPYGAMLEEAVQGRSEEEKIPRPELDIFDKAMVAGGKVTGRAQVYDFPWASLGKATVVDVGGGMGGFCLQLSHKYPSLNLVVQDRPSVVGKAKDEIWLRENPKAVDEGRVTFMPHDFFEANPVKGAGIYWLRYVLHDWSDDYCVRILNGVRQSMGPKSRVLVCDFVMTSTLGHEALPSAPSPLPANWGYFTRYAHGRDIAMMCSHNGIERRPTEFEALIEKAGLKLKKIWDCRSSVAVIEAVLPDSEV